MLTVLISIKAQETALDGVYVLRTSLESTLMDAATTVKAYKSLFEDYSYFDESFRLTCDYELLLRSLKQENPVFIITG